uniref:Impact N-terminal domain-containing protein n=1 Tax=Salmo trutta TaxID=8032 RepID=A0A673WH00_SALTR
EQNIDILGPWAGNSPDLSSIENLWSILEAAIIFCIKMTDVDHPKLKAYLQFHNYIILPHDYPNAAPLMRNILENIAAKWTLFSAEESKAFKDIQTHTTGSLNREKQRHTNTHLQYISQPVHLSTFLTVDQPKLNTENVHLFENHSIGMALTAVFLNGEQMRKTNRRSTFQPQLPTVVTPRQLLCRTGPHLIYCEDKQSFLQDREDDGDTTAGGQLLHLLQVLCSVWLSRWYGGILLGPDRFQHINNSARNILVQEGYTSSAVRPSLPISNVSKFGTSPH